MIFIDDPIRVFLFFLAVLWVSSLTGGFLRGSKQDDSEHEDLGVILNATLTLLGLIIGFSFSMATSRYDQRKNYEEEEANAIGTEYLRLGLLPDADTAKARNLLKTYLDQRILFYTTGDAGRIAQINATTAQLQNDLWSIVQASAAAKPTPASALAAAGMNDVLNRQGYTQASWWNRIPAAAWGLMLAIAVCCNLLMGYNARHSLRTAKGILLPLIVSFAFFLIADLDSPRGGVINVSPQNLLSVAGSLRGQ